jgi:hypothetical protein
MQITTNALETMPDPSDWFSGAEYAAAPLIGNEEA